MFNTMHTVLLRSIRSSRILAILAAMALLAVPSTGVAQAPADGETKTTATDTAKSSDGTWHMIKGRNVNVRCAPSVSRSYSIGRLARDTPVVVIDQADGWASVRTFGPAFGPM